MHDITTSVNAEVFCFGEFIFDCGSHMLHRDGQELHLSPKARQLLRMLIVNRPNALAREEIYDALWPATYVSETNMASVVSELRRVLGDHARSAHYIRTVHGFGYAFAADVKPKHAKPIVAAMLLCEGQRHLLHLGNNVLGRSQDCDVILSGATVSRHHAVITVTDNAIWIEDSGSRNGTWLNGRPITRAQFQRNDAITFGAVPAAISRKISSTLPLPIRFHEPGHRSSGSAAPV